MAVKGIPPPVASPQENGVKRKVRPWPARSSDLIGYSSGHKFAGIASPSRSFCTDARLQCIEAVHSLTRPRDTPSAGRTTDTPCTLSWSWSFHRSLLLGFASRCLCGYDISYLKHARILPITVVIGCYRRLLGMQRPNNVELSAAGP